MISDLLLGCLATHGMTEWFRHDHRVQALLSGLHGRDDDSLGTIERTVKDATLCGFCLSHWFAGVAVALLAPRWLFPLQAWTLIPYGLAAAFAFRSAAGLVNDLTARWCRTPESPTRPRDPA